MTVETAWWAEGGTLSLNALRKQDMLAASCLNILSVKQATLYALIQTLLKFVGQDRN